MKPAPIHSSDALHMNTTIATNKLVYNGRFTSQKTTGVQRVARELVAALGQLPQGSHMTLAVPPQGGLDPVQGVEAVKLGFGKGVFWEQIVLPLFAGRSRIVNLSNSGSIFRANQIIYMHDAAVFDTPAHFSWKFRTWYHVMFWILARTSSCVLTNSQFSRDRLAHHVGVPAERIGVVPLAADHLDHITPDVSVIDELKLTKQRYVLAVSSMNPTKNFKRLVEAFMRLNDPSIDLVIVGMKNAAIFGKAHDLSSAPNIKQAGYVSDEKLRALYQNAACFLYPSVYEGFGIPPLEAMRNGCPTLVGRAAALPETCGDASIYCDPYSVEDISNKLRELLDSPELSEDLRRRGLAHAERFRWTESARLLMQFIDKP
ncbi:group 1 glycosyl transferase [Caballeronia glebae]|uniref:Group 1 glycosyl transferase n=2 Tax=Caballeronia glebae TaxID=1777143 RepID=A0A158C147_9BURK|nr:group 1 glycosyl transferase [Caballeronia glebae]